MEKELIKVIEVNKEECVNCHMCISVCPKKYCNDASGETVEINHNLCVGCGNCIKACTHNARKGVDDISDFIEDVKRGRIVSIVAPAIAANFPNQYLKINGWLKSLGVEANFDVSFGAELTIKTYLEYAKKENPKAIITQPCPALVTSIEIYFPELIEYLAPADSPMVHTLKMIKEYYPEFKNHKTVVISPCFAKKREYEATGFGDYNVTFESLQKHFKENNINLFDYDEVEYDNPSAERAVLFSSPGGLMRTAIRDNKDISEVTRKIEGTHTIYEYFEKLKKGIESGKAPFLIDCLNCEMGCNGGPATLNKDKSVDEIEYLIEARNKEVQKKYKKTGLFKDKDPKDVIGKVIDKYWKEGLYCRKYENLSDNYKLKIKQPSNKEEEVIYRSMNKNNGENHYNCASCGYNSCEGMMIAIHNNLNQTKNCHFYMADEIKEQKLEEQSKREKLKTNFINMKESLNNVDVANEELTKEIINISERMDKMNFNVGKLTSLIKEVNGYTSQSDEILNKISSGANQTNLLALNASIEAARAGEAGKGFTVVANEIKTFASQSAKNVSQVKEFLDDINNNLEGVNKNSDNVNYSSNEINQAIETISATSEEISAMSSQLVNQLDQII